MGLPKKCPECRGELHLPVTRVRQAIDNRLHDIWSIRRRLSHPAVPGVALPAVLLEESSQRNVISYKLLFCLILSTLVQWVSIVLNMYYLFTQRRLYQLLVLYLLVV